MNAITARRLAAIIGMGLLGGSLFGTPRAVRAQLAGAPAPVQAQQQNASGGVGNVSLDQKLDAQISLNTVFRDESGKTVPLGSYFKDRPVLLVMPFYKCPGVCTAELDGMVKTFQDPRLKFKVGRDFDVVTVSIDPKEGSDLAAMKKKEYMNLLGQPDAAGGWHFLTGEQSSIRSLADQVGFHYTHNVKTDQYAHPAGLILLTPGGKVSKYFYGVEYSPKDLRLAMTDAGQGKVGSLVDQIALLCCSYDPQTGTYSVAVFRIIQFGALTTVLILGTGLLVAFRKDYGGVK